MNPILYLHIGLPKTATSSIQGFMSDNRAALKRKGILYPDTGRKHTAHHPFAGALSERKFDWINALDPYLLKVDLLKEIRDSGCTRVVLSSEAFSHGDRFDLEKVREFFSEWTVKIVISLRRQDEWLESVVRDNMKTGAERTSSVEDVTIHRKASVDFASRIETWASHFGGENIIVNIFDPKASDKPVEQSFLETIGGGFDADLEVGRRINERLSQDCLAFLMNSPHKRRIYPFYWKTFRILAAYSKENPDPGDYKYVLSPDQRGDIMADVSEGNSAIARTYLDRPDGILFDGAASMDAAWRPYPGLSVEKSTEIGIYLSRKLYWEMVGARGPTMPPQGVVA